MTESMNREGVSAVACSEEEAVTQPLSLESRSTQYSDLLGLFPAELFEGLEEFVRRSRERSRHRREPPSWW